MDYFRNTPRAMCGKTAGKVYRVCTIGFVTDYVLNLASFRYIGSLILIAVAEQCTPAFTFSKNPSSFTIRNLLF